MARKIYRLISWSLLILTLVSILLILRKPSVVPVETSPQAAKSFDEKLAQLARAHQQGAPQEIRITETELNSKLQQGVQEASGGAAGATGLNAAAIHLESDELVGTFTVSVAGKDVYVTLGGKLAVQNKVLQFTPTQMKMGSLPVPISVVESTLRKKFNSPEMRDRMKLPDFVKDIRIENGELVLQSM
jgi:uncharacterized protein YpmS